MKKMSLFFAAAFMFLLLCHNEAMARSLTVVNKCGAAIVALNISQTGSDNYSNLLKKNLPDGQSITLQLADGNNDWNVLAIDSKDRAHVSEGLSFAKITSLVITNGKITLK